MMTTLHKTKTGETSYTKGSPELVLNGCNKILINGKIKRLTRNIQKEIIQKNEEFASQALRVLGFAYKHNTNKKSAEKEMTFLGLQAMIDPPRESSIQAVKSCHDAGIKVIMITGDHKITAVAIADELGIKGKALSGEELDKIKDLDSMVESIAVYARVNPEHKMRIIDALQRKGHVVAMTGDGVNDAPALKSADIGICVGSGTDVAKEASEMILTDDNFASIVNSVEEGRGIYDNIKKFVNYLLSSNFGEVLILFVAIMIGWPLPLAAVHILWVNLVTDGLPALALGVDPISKGVMKKSPRKKKEHIISHNMTANIIVIGILICIGTLTLFKFGLTRYDEITARTIAFSTLVVLELVRLYMIRAKYKLSIFSNKWLMLAIIFSMALQLGVVYLPFSASIFKTVPLPAIEWLYMAIVAGILLVTGFILNLIIERLTHEKD